MKADLEQKLTDALKLHNDATDTMDERVYHLVTNNDFSYPRIALVSSTTSGSVVMIVVEDNEALWKTLEEVLSDPDISIVEGIEDSFLLHKDELWEVRLW